MERLKNAAWLGAPAAVWAYAVFQYGGVVGLDRKIYLLALGVAALAWWMANRRGMASMPRMAGWCAWLLPAYAACQLIPLPRGVLAVLSPARVELMRGLDGVAAPEGWATLSVVPGATMNHFLLLAGYAVVFLLMYQLGARLRWAAMLPVAIAAALEAVLGIAQAAAGQMASGTYVNRDHYAGLLEMALPFALLYPVAVWRGLDTRRGFPMKPAVVMCASLGAAALILAGSLASLSRMGFVAPLFSAAVMGIVAWRGNGLRSAGLVGLLAAGLAVCFVVLPSDELISRFAKANDDMTAEGRTELWKESLGLVRAYPVFGCGLGGYESAFLRYKVSVPMVSDDRAHNDYLQFLIELGAAGFVIGLALMGSIVARTWRSAARSADPESRFLAIACIGAMAAIGLHSMVDFNLYVPANAMLLAWICGVALSIGPGRGARDPRDGRLPVTIDLTAVPRSWQ